MTKGHLQSFFLPLNLMQSGGFCDGPPETECILCSVLLVLLCINGRRRKKTMLWTLVAVLLILWLLGFSFSIGGSLIHLLLVVALIVMVINLVSGRRAI
jgi:hypothetical protein